VVATNQAAGKIADISNASAKQANSIDELSQTVATIDKGTQQNAALAEQSSASAAALAQQVRRLDQLINIFNVGESTVDTRHRQKKVVAN
jgi:methyl-accepting chemotaxis protein